MTTWNDRLAVGTSLEQRVARELEARGWTVTQWGQGTLPEIIRQTIREIRSPARFHPDLIAGRPGEVVTIDAKERMHSTASDRYAVSRECVNAGLQFHAVYCLPVFYVFGNLGVLCPTEIITYGQIGPRATTGAYYLVNGRLAHIFDDIFGQPKDMAA